MNNTTRLADCAQILIGKNIDKAKTNEKEEGYPIIVGASDIQQGRICCKRYVVPENVKNPVLAKKGDIIISTVGTLGKIGVMDIEQAIVSKHVVAIRPHKTVCIPYFVALLSRLLLDMPAQEEEVIGFSKKMDIIFLENLTILLPSYEEQERIITEVSKMFMSYFLMEFETANFLTTADFLNTIKERYATWKKEERPKAIALIEKLSSLLREIEVTEATIEEHDRKYNKIKNRYLNL